MVIKWLSFLGLISMAIGPASYASEASAWAKSNEIRGSIGVGYGELGTPIALHNSAHFNWLPQLAWYGEKFYFENGLLGFSLSEHVQEQWDLVVYPNDDGLLYRLNSAFAPTLAVSPIPYPSYPREISLTKTPDRHISTMAGLRYAQQWEQFDWSAQLGIDASAVHHGWELSTRINLPAIYESENFTLALDAGLTIKSASLVDYYYTPVFGEIAPVEGGIYGTCDVVTNLCNYAISGPYDGHTGYRSHFSFKANYEINASWSLALMYRHYYLSQSMTQSPIVTTNHYAAWFSGLFYRF